MNIHIRKIFSMAILLVFFQVNAQQIERIEPPFWWQDMHNQELQLLVYGKNISNLSVLVSDGEILSIIKTENPNYLFVNLNLANVTSNSFNISFKKGRKLVYSQKYELKKRRDKSAQRQGFDSSDAIYLLMPDRFSNGDKSNDSQADLLEKVNRNFDGGRHGGDIQGIINHIDYLKDLGITTLWSTPLLETNEATYSYHGYAATDCYEIDARYGNNNDYKRLAKILHQNNMKLIMDFVTNHWGDQHWIIKDLPAKDWVHYWENENISGFKRSNYRMTTQFDKHATQTDKNACENGWFDQTMPDLNQDNPLLLKYLTQNAIWWIEYANLDGLRVDTYSYNSKEAIAKWTKVIMQEYPNFNIVGEVWMHNQAQIAYWQKDSRIGEIDSYNSNLPSVMDFTLHDAMISMFNEDVQVWDKGMVRAYDNFANDFLYPNINNIMVFAGNHDTTRINEYYQGDIKKYKLALTLLLTTRGIPQLYYADEIGMRGNKEKNGDGDLRKDFPGGWATDTTNAFIKRNAYQADFYNFTKTLLNWRKHKKLIHYGDLKQFVPVNNVYVYFRLNENEKVMVVINNNSSKQTINWQNYKELLSNDQQGFDIISQQKIDLSKPYILASKTSMIIEFE